MSDKQIDHIKAIIQSMTPKERSNPETLNVSRKKRIAKVLVVHYKKSIVL